jgi:hypothetical protein
MMRKALVVALLVVGWMSASAQPGPAIRREVRITAQQVQINPPAYVFLITNLTDVPLASIDIGRWLGDPNTIGKRGYGIIAGALNRPTRMGVPPGWTTLIGGSGGTSYFGYGWETTDVSKAIKPGESRCDFRVDLPVFVPPKTPLYGNGILLAQTDFDKVPFLVIWRDGGNDGRCDRDAPHDEVRLATLFSLAPDRWSGTHVIGDESPFVIYA